VIFVEEVVVARVTILQWRGMAGAGLLDHGHDLESGHHRSIRLSTDDVARDDSVGDDDDRLCGERGLLRHAPRAEELCVPVRVGELDGDDRDVRRDRGDEHDRRAIERRRRGDEGRICSRDIAAEDRPRRDVGRAQRAREQRLRDGEVRVVADLDPPRDALLHRAPVRVGEAGGDVADPGRGHAPDAPSADELVERDVGDRTDQLEIAPALTDELVRERERDRRLERATQRDRGTVGNEARDRLVRRDQLGHAVVRRIAAVHANDAASPASSPYTTIVIMLNAFAPVATMVRSPTAPQVTNARAPMKGRFRRRASHSGKSPASADGRMPYVNGKPICRSISPASDTG
jgi:hypothetical protein